MDRLWSEGWRHFGALFYRYQQAMHGGALMDVRPLRVLLESWTASKSQRRVLRRNADLEVRVRPTQLDDERRALFQRHKQRFVDNVPESLEDFLGVDPSMGPCLNVEVGIFLRKQLVAASYMDVGKAAVSSIYGFFDPDHAARRLGILTMLVEMDWARSRGCQFYYPGYAYRQPSHYDYKKQFHAMEEFDWTAWQPRPRLVEGAAEDGQ